MVDSPDLKWNKLLNWNSILEHIKYQLWALLVQTIIIIKCTVFIIVECYGVTVY